MEKDIQTGFEISLREEKMDIGECQGMADRVLACLCGEERVS